MTKKLSLRWVESTGTKERIFSQPESISRTFGTSRFRGAVLCGAVSAFYIFSRYIPLFSILG